MSLLLFFTFIICISLYPVLLHRNAQQHDVSPVLWVFSLILFMTAPIIAIVIMFQLFVNIIITGILGVIS